MTLADSAETEIKDRFRCSKVSGIIPKKKVRKKIKIY
jgi:hypothetical protein